jgi:hypothetical protein
VEGADRPVKKAKKAAKKRPPGAERLAGAGGPSGPRPPEARPRPPERVEGADRPVKAAKKAAKKRPPGAERPARPGEPEGRRRPPEARSRPPERVEGADRPVKKAKKAKKAAKRRPPGADRPARPGEEGTRAPRSGGAADPDARKPAKATKATKAKKAAKRPSARPPAEPVLHDWATEDEWGSDGGDATAAVPAAELLAPSSPSVVVRGMPSADPVGFDDLAVGAPVLDPEPDLYPDGYPPEPTPEPPQRLTRSGKPKKLRGKAKRIHKAKTRPPSRLLNHYDVNGPRIRLGFLWFLGLVAAIGAETATDLPFLAVVYGGAAGFAGWQAAREWRKRGTGAVPWAAAAIGAALGLAGSQDPRTVGIVVLVAIPVAAIAGLADEQAREALPGNIGLTLQSGLFVGLAAATVPLAWGVKPAAAIGLILLVSAYEVGDYVVGSGSLNPFEGPIAGILAVAAVMLPLYAVQLPPIDSETFLTYGLIVAVGCPLSQIAGSAVLPWSDAPAPALRRLDSLLLTGPIWLAVAGAQLGAF